MYGVIYSCFDKGCPIKAYATMPIGIMGNNSLALFDCSLRCLEGMNAGACAVSFCHAETT